MKETIEVVDLVVRTGLIAILRGFSPDQASRAGQALVRGGARVVEVSLVDPDALASIRVLRQEVDDSCAVGAGTVLNVSEAESAIEVGADFLFSPGLNAEVLRIAEANKVLAIPGVLTPTEITRALAWRSPLVKLFPAAPFGPDYLRQLLGPFPNLKVVATGGIGASNAASYLAAGAVAFGVGSSIAKPRWAEAGAYERFEQAARDFIQSLAVERENS